MGSPSASLMPALTFLRTCAVRNRHDDGTNLLPRHQQDVRALQRTPLQVTESGDWNAVDRALWQLQAAHDLVGVAEAYVEVAEHVIPEFMPEERDD